MLRSMWEKRIHSLRMYWSSNRRMGKEYDNYELKYQYLKENYCIIQEKINVNKFRLRDIMRLNGVLKVEKSMRYI